MDADVAAAIGGLGASLEALEKRVDELEELLTKVRNEITEMKKFEWGTRVDPPTIKKEIC